MDTRSVCHYSCRTFSTRDKSGLIWRWAATADSLCTLMSIEQHKMTIETILTPAELPGLTHRDLGGTACVVFDILRATSTFVTALQNGAREIIPASEIPEAVAVRRERPEVLLAGERNGVKIQKGHGRPLGTSPE